MWECSGHPVSVCSTPSFAHLLWAIAYTSSQDFWSGYCHVYEAKLENWASRRISNSRMVTQLGLKTHESSRLAPFPPWLTLSHFCIKISCKWMVPPLISEHRASLGTLRVFTYYWYFYLFILPFIHLFVVVVVCVCVCVCWGTSSGEFVLSCGSWRWNPGQRSPHPLSHLPGPFFDTCYLTIFT